MNAMPPSNRFHVHVHVADLDRNIGFYTQPEAIPYAAPDPTTNTDAQCCGPETPQGVCCPPKPELAADAPCCSATVHRSAPV